MYRNCADPIVVLTFRVSGKAGRHTAGVGGAQLVGDDQVGLRARRVHAAVPEHRHGDERQAHMNFTEKKA